MKERKKKREEEEEEKLLTTRGVEEQWMKEETRETVVGAAIRFLLDSTLVPSMLYLSALSLVSSFPLFDYVFDVLLLRF